MVTRKKGAVKAMIIFLAIMAALTFFSRTIHYGTLPKVEVQRVNGGVLYNEISGDAFVLESDQSKRINVSLDISEYKLLVEVVNTQRHAFVKAGDLLLRFDPEVSANSLEKSDIARQRAQEALAAWDQAYLEAWNKLNDEATAVSRKMAEADADMEVLTAQFTSLQDARGTLEKTRMLNGVTRLEKEQTLAAARAKQDALQELADQGWAVYASEEGLISEVLVEAGDAYAGLSPLAYLIPAGTTFRVGIKTDAAVQVLSQDNVVVYGGDSLQDSGETGWRYAGESAQRNSRIFWAEPTDGAAAFADLKKLTFRVASEYYQHLVPNSAVVGNAVFVLDSRAGAFGVEETFARRVELGTVLSDTQNTCVPSGLGNTDRIIVKWDRPFENGDTVVLPLD